MNNFSSLLRAFQFDFVSIGRRLVASLSPVYAFNSKLKIIHHSSIVDFIIDLLLNESQRNDMHGMEKTRKIIRFVSVFPVYWISLRQYLKVSYQIQLKGFLAKI